MKTAHSSTKQLKARIRNDAAFAAGLHALKTTAEASRFCQAHKLNVSPEMLWRQRGQLFADSQPTWRG